jgi:hypothetical protein
MPSPTASTERYTVTTIVLPDEVKSRIIDELKGDEANRAPLRYALGFGSIFGLLLSVSAWFLFRSPGAVAIGAVIGLGLGFPVYLTAKKSADQIAGLVAQAVKATHCERHTLNLDGPHRFVFHEHGLLVLASLGPERTFFYDISNCSDDLLDEPVNKARKAGDLLSLWTWHKLDGTTGFHAFNMEGKPLVPSVREEFSDDQEFGEFVDLFGDEWMPDDFIAKLDFNDLLQRDEALRARYATDMENG